MIEKKHLFGKIKDIFSIIGNILLILAVFSLFAVITALFGKVINYSPWSLLIIDIIFVLVVKKFVEKFYNENEKINKFWGLTLLVLIVLGIVISIGVSLVHPWAILNIVALIFLFFFFSVMFIGNKVRDDKHSE